MTHCNTDFHRDDQYWYTGWFISSDSWVGLTLIYDVPLSCPAAQSFLPISHLPKQNQAEGGRAKIKVKPTQLSEQMDHSVQCLSDSKRRMGNCKTVTITDYMEF